jgi:hypothetical protein
VLEGQPRRLISRCQERGRFRPRQRGLFANPVNVARLHRAGRPITYSLEVAKARAGVAKTGSATAPSNLAGLPLIEGQSTLVAAPRTDRRQRLATVADDVLSRVGHDRPTELGSYPEAISLPDQCRPDEQTEKDDRPAIKFEGHPNHHARGRRPPAAANHPVSTAILSDW